MEQTQAGTWEIWIRYKGNDFCHDSDPRQTQFVQRHSVCGGGQALTGQIPQQPDLIRSGLSSVGLDDLWEVLPVSLLWCGFLISAAEQAKQHSKAFLPRQEAACSWLSHLSA